MMLYVLAGAAIIASPFLLSCAVIKLAAWNRIYRNSNTRLLAMNAKLSKRIRELEDELKEWEEIGLDAASDMRDEVGFVLPYPESQPRANAHLN